MDAVLAAVFGGFPHESTWAKQGEAVENQKLGPSWGGVG